jgi:ketosteroid isomerase-like protein
MSAKDMETMVQRYFAEIEDLRQGKESAVDRLLEMWDENGVFEFAGSPEVAGMFTGKNAIRVMYKNRVKEGGMKVRLETGAEKSVALGDVKTKVSQIKSINDTKMVASWTTLISTREGHGFEVPGSHTFNFKAGKLANLKVVVSPTAKEAPGFEMKGLNVKDVGRLSLAAWAVA